MCPPAALRAGAAIALAWTPADAAPPVAPIPPRPCAAKPFTLPIKRIVARLARKSTRPMLVTCIPAAEHQRSYRHYFAIGYLMRQLRQRFQYAPFTTLRAVDSAS